MVDEQAHEPAADDLGEQHLDRPARRRASRALDVGLDRALIVFSPLSNKKAGERPLSGSDPPAGRESCRDCYSTGEPATPSRAAAPCAVPVDAVVARGPAAVRRRARAACAPPSGGPARMQRAAEAEERVVVGRRALDDGLELAPRGLELARAEVGPAERLADRGLVRLEVARPCASGTVGGVEVAGLEQLHPALEEVVRRQSMGPSSVAPLRAQGIEARRRQRPPRPQRGRSAARRRGPARSAARGAGRASARAPRPP